MSRNSNSGENAMGSIKETAQHITDNLRDVGQQARDVAAEKLGNIRQQAGEYYDQGKHRAEEWEQGIEQYVQDKPIQSLLIAAGVGVLLGILWKRS
jgi:ElaB/YqjD/DUF883 family membrane-anchored ribosome-binding protein